MEGVIVSLQGVQKSHLVKGKRFIGSVKRNQGISHLVKMVEFPLQALTTSLHALKAVCLNLPLDVKDSLSNYLSWS